MSGSPHQASGLWQFCLHSRFYALPKPSPQGVDKGNALFVVSWWLCFCNYLFHCVLGSVLLLNHLSFYTFLHRLLFYARNGHGDNSRRSYKMSQITFFELPLLLIFLRCNGLHLPAKKIHNASCLHFLSMIFSTLQSGSCLDTESKKL